MRRTLRYGGEIETGDVIAISFNNWITVAFYLGNGQNKSLQYLTPTNILWARKAYDEWEDKGYPPHAWRAKYFMKGWGLHCIYKDFIWDPGDGNHRVMKINDPLAIILDKEERDDFIKAREILINLKVIKE